MGKRKGKSVRNNKQLHIVEEDEARAPHSFVIHKGQPGKFVQELAKDFRRVMEPYTASNIRVRPKNVVKDFVQVAGPLNVTHLCLFTKTPLSPYLKIARFPRGPSLTFRVDQYSLGRDVRSSLKRQVTYEKQFINHALLVMNNFPSEGREFQLMVSMFQNMLPSINVAKIKVNTIRRCVLLNYNRETNQVEFRHYTIKLVPVGINRSIKKIVTSKIPNLGRLEDMAEMLTKATGMASESEAEEDENSRVVVPDDVSVRGAMPAQQTSVRLVELGPRMSLQLLKIEEGFLEGEVLYHQYVEKTEAEVKELRAKKEARKREKEKRRREQEKNVRKKQEERAKHKEKSLKGMAAKGDTPKFDAKERRAIKDWQGETAQEDDDDNDEEWYRKEVGEAPDKELFAKSKSAKSSLSGVKRFDKNKKRGNKPAQGSRGFNKEDDRKKDKKRKSRMKVFNADGVGPNYRKGSGEGKKSALRGVKRGKVTKKGHKRR